MADSPFIMGVRGEFGPGQIRITWHDEPRPPHAVLDALVAQAWAERCQASQRDGTLLFNGQLVRHLRHRIDTGILLIDAGPTDYRDFLGTNLTNAHRGEEFGWELFGNAIGTSATVITSDGWLHYGVRSQQVASHCGYVHPFGGMLEAADRCLDGTVDAFGSIRREVEEELGLSSAQIEAVVCLGLIRDPQVRQPELVFDVHVRGHHAEMAGRIDPADPQQEHLAMVACRDEPQAIAPFIRSAGKITPVAVGALCLHGWRRFGEGWYASSFRELGEADG